MLAPMAAALVLVLAATTTSSDRPRAQTVTVVATDCGFDPGRLMVRVGVPSRLYLGNRGNDLHERTGPAFLTSLQLGKAESLSANRR
jgi:hypothetical protein